MTDENITLTTDQLEPPANAIDIGGGHRIVFVEFEGEKAAIDDWHLKADGTWCKGFIDFKGGTWAPIFGPDKGWDLIQLEPLTLSPSLLCRACGDHGFIRNGKWVKA